MDTQRDIYRQLILKLFKENFEAALFIEKRDNMMANSDFERIRDEIEEEYFTKNHGIAPYIKAIKYLRTKIEAKTADNALFVAVEDYICAKENISIAKIVKVQLQPKTVEPAKRKRRGQPKQNKPIATSTVHPECNSPQSCKKCRIMRRLNRPEKKEKKQSKKLVKSAGAKVKTMKPSYSDISDSEATNTSSETSSLTPMLDAAIDLSRKARDKPNMQLPYMDHPYSRISFYGTGLKNEVENESNKVDLRQQVPASNESKQPMYNVFNGSVCANGNIVKPKPNPKAVIRPKPVIYHFRPNNGIRQPAPAFYMPNFITSASTLTTQTPPMRSIYRPAANILVNSVTPTQFRSPITVVQRPIAQHPIYYVSFCQPNQLQRQ